MHPLYNVKIIFCCNLTLAQIIESPSIWIRLTILYSFMVYVVSILMLQDLSFIYDGCARMKARELDNSNSTSPLKVYPSTREFENLDLPKIWMNVSFDMSIITTTFWNG